MQSFISTVSLDAFSDKDYLNYSLSEIDKRYFFSKIKDYQEYMHINIMIQIQ
jgi:hypothetical protein